VLLPDQHAGRQGERELNLPVIFTDQLNQIAAFSPLNREHATQPLGQVGDLRLLLRR
jgi:hypothetical protein